jgi:hypothetical protein
MKPMRTPGGFLGIGAGYVARNDVRDLVYRRLAQLLVESHGTFAIELARKRAVACRLMGDQAELRHWSRLCCDVEVVLQQRRESGLPPAQLPQHGASLYVLPLKP